MRAPEDQLLGGRALELESLSGRRAVEGGQVRARRLFATAGEAQRLGEARSKASLVFWMRQMFEREAVKARGPIERELRRGLLGLTRCRTRARASLQRVRAATTHLVIYPGYF